MATPSLQDILNEVDDDAGLLSSPPPSSQPTASQLLFSPTEASSDPFSGLLPSRPTASATLSNGSHAADPFSHLLSDLPQQQPQQQQQQSGRMLPTAAAPLQPFKAVSTPLVGSDPLSSKAAAAAPLARVAAADPFSDLISLSSSSSSSVAAASAPLGSSALSSSSPSVLSPFPSAASGLPPSLASLPSVSVGRPSAPVLSVHVIPGGAGEDSTVSSAFSSASSSPLSASASASASASSLPHSASTPLSPYSTSAATAQDRQLLQSILSEQAAEESSSHVRASTAAGSSASSVPSGRPSAASGRRVVTPLTAVEIAAIANPLKRAEAVEQQKSLVGNYRLVEPLRAKREQMRAQPVHNILRLQPLAGMRAELERARSQLGEWTCVAIGQRYMAVGTVRGCILVFNHFEQLQCVLGKPAEDSRTRGAVTCIDMNPTGDQVVAGHARGVCAVWDIATRKEVKDIKDASTRPITHVRFTKRGRPVFVAVDDQGIVTLFTLNKVSILSAPHTHCPLPAQFTAILAAHHIGVTS